MNGSKEGQDRFAEIINQGKPGFFLDLGCAHPSDGNNSWRLEQNGWRGVLFDNNRSAIDQCHLHRSNPAFCVDLANFDMMSFLWNSNLPMVIDYMSLDIDAATDAFVRNFDWNHKHRRVRCMTVEHDSYGHNFRRKDAIREVMQYTNYRILAEDVRFSDKNGHEHPWEDWYVYDELIPEPLRKLSLKDLTWEKVLAAMSDAMRIAN